MDKEKTKDLIKIMQAFLEGEVIEQRTVVAGNDLTGWFTHSSDNWDTTKYMYRIKPKPQYRPFKDGNECWKEMKNHQPFGWVKINDKYTHIVELDASSKELLFVYDRYHDWKDTFKSVTFADGTPFGMKVTDNCPMLRKAPK